MRRYHVQKRVSLQSEKKKLQRHRCAQLTRNISCLRLFKWLHSFGLDSGNLKRNQNNLKFLLCVSVALSCSQSAVRLYHSNIENSAGSLALLLLCADVYQKYKTKTYTYININTQKTLVISSPVANTNKLSQSSLPMTITPRLRTHPYNIFTTVIQQPRCTPTYLYILA